MEAWREVCPALSSRRCEAYPQREMCHSQSVAVVILLWGSCILFISARMKDIFIIHEVTDKGLLK